MLSCDVSLRVPFHTENTCAFRTQVWMHPYYRSILTATTSPKRDKRQQVGGTGSKGTKSRSMMRNGLLKPARDWRLLADRSESSQGLSMEWRGSLSAQVGNNNLPAWLEELGFPSEFNSPTCWEAKFSLFFFF